jgi:hypothetical protein
VGISQGSLNFERVTLSASIYLYSDAYDSITLSTGIGLCFISFPRYIARALVQASQTGYVILLFWM